MVKTKMTNSEICENCGFEKYRHNEKEGIVYTGLEPRIYDCSKVCKKFTPKIEEMKAKDFVEAINKSKLKGFQFEDTPRIEKTGCGKEMKDRDGLTFAICGEKDSLCPDCQKKEINNQHGRTSQDNKSRQMSCDVQNSVTANRKPVLGSLSISGFSTHDEIIEKVLKEQKKQNEYDVKNKIDPLYSIKTGSSYESKQMFNDVIELIEAVAKVNAEKALSEADKQKDKTLEEIKAGIEEFKKRIMINGNLSHRIIETPNGEFQYSHDYVLNNIVIELIDEIFDNALKEKGQ